MKSRNGILFGLTAGVLFAVQNVKADIIPGIISKPIEQLFSGIPQAYMARFIIAILAFTIFFAVMMQFNILGSKDENKGKKGIPITIAIAMALITTLAIPDAIATAIFTWYGGIFSLLLFLAPLIGILIYTYKTENTTPMNHATRFIIFALLAAVFLGKIWLDWFLPQGASGDFTVKDVIDLAGVVMFILAIVELVRFFSSLKKGASSPTSTIDSGNRPELTNETLDGPDSSSISDTDKLLAQQRLKEAEADRARKKADEEARKLEEHGRAMGQLIVQGHNLLERIKDGLNKLRIAMERSDFKDIISDVKSKITDSLTNDAAEIKKNEEDITKNGDKTSKEFNEFISSIESQSNATKAIIDECIKTRDIATQNLNRVKDANIRRLLERQITNSNELITLHKDIELFLEAEIKKAREIGKPLAEKHQQLRRMVVPAVKGLQKATSDISNSTDVLLANPGDPKKRGEEYSKLVNYMNQAMPNVVAIEQLYDEYIRHVNELTTFCNNMKSIANRKMNAGIGESVRLQRENQVIEDDIKKIEDEKKKAEKKDEMVEKAVAKAEVKEKAAEVKGEINKPALEMRLRNLRNQLPISRGVMREQIEKDIREIEGQINVATSITEAEKDIKKAKTKKVPPKELVERLKRLQENLKITRGVTRDRIEADIKEVEKLLKDYS